MSSVPVETSATPLFGRTQEKKPVKRREVPAVITESSLVSALRTFASNELASDEHHRAVAAERATADAEAARQSGRSM